MVVTLILLAVFVVVDLFVIGRRPHVPSTKECVQHIAFFVVAALLFGGVLWLISGPQPAIEFYSGWLTEYSLSIDNLFVFVIIMGQFAVPRQLQKYVLSVGIAIALVLRGVFILVGVTLIDRFTWIFFIFGVFLLYTSFKVARGQDEGGYKENRLVGSLRRVMRISDAYDGERLTVKRDGVTYFTPMLIVFLAIGTTDVMFAFDSIPAIFGLTHDPFIVFTSNVFALLGLQQLYFLLGAMLDKLAYLPIGLSIVLAFIGVKLIMEALHGNSLPFINGGQPLDAVPEVPTWLSLAVIVLAIGGASLASLIKARRSSLKTSWHKDGDE